MRGGRADVQLAVLFADVVQLFEAAEVDQMLRRGQAQLHHRDQAHAAGQRLGAVRDQRQRFIESLAARCIRMRARSCCWLR